MSSNNELVRIGDSALGRCLSGQTQYSSRYLSGLGSYPALGGGLNFVEDKANYHATRIAPKDACILASRILLHRIATGTIAENAIDSLPCAGCPNAEEVMLDRSKVE